MRDLRSQRVARVWRGSDGKVHRESERPVLSVHGELHVMCGYIAEAREMARPSGDVRALVAWLDVQLDWATRQPGVVELARVVRELAGQLRPVTGEPGRKRIGSCPVTIDEGEHTRECGAPLFAPLRGDEIVCPSGRRDHRWPRAEWLKLGQMIQLEVAS